MTDGLFLSTLSLRRATWHGKPTRKARHISIHALLAESDHTPCRPVVQRVHFYPRSPCGERLAAVPTAHLAALFLSTLSLRRATYREGLHHMMQADFYPRSPCGERPLALAVAFGTHQAFLSTLSLRRATSHDGAGMAAGADFYPRSPCGERLWWRVPVLIRAAISIHALLAESDPCMRRTVEPGS